MRDKVKRICEDCADVYVHPDNEPCVSCLKPTKKTIALKRKYVIKSFGE